MATVNIKDLIAKKEEIQQKKENKTATLAVDSLGGSIKITKPTGTMVRDAREMGSPEGDVYLIYNNVTEPNLKDPELQKAYGCVEPTEIVEKLFEDGEVALISQEIIKLAGYVDGVKALKN